MQTFEEWFNKFLHESDDITQPHLEERKIAMHLAWTCSAIATRKAIKDGTFDLLEFMEKDG